jgi:hypothetical protein
MEYALERTMRYLRMLTNAALAGALGPAFLAVLMLQLNPQIPLEPGVGLRLLGTLMLFYGLLLALAFYLLILSWQLVSRERLSPGWLSLRILAWLSTAVCGGAAALMWLNVSGFEPVLEPDAARRMTAGAAATAVCALLLFVIAAVHYSFGRRGSRVGGTLFAITVVAALVLPLTARGRGSAPQEGQALAPAPPFTPVLPLAPSPGRLVMVVLDGASLEHIAPATTGGRLPNFGRMLDTGASLHLGTLRPTQPGPVWAAAATGKLPHRNGVRSAARYVFGAEAHPLELLPDLCFAHALVHFGLVEARPHDAAALRTRTFWEILSAHGVSVGVVGMPLMAPVQPVLGYLVADGLRAASSRPGFEGYRTLVHPPEAIPLVRQSEAALDLEPPEPGQDTSQAQRRATAGGPVHLPTRRDVWYRQAAMELEREHRPRLTIVRYEGIDIAGHHYLRHAKPHAFGDVSEEERTRFGQALDRQYALVDEEIGRLMAVLEADDVLVVMSGFGMDPVSPGKRLLAWLLRDADLTGTHERAPDGFLLAFGGPVAAGRLAIGSVLDVAPTALYFLGLPVARDMDGYARADLFKRAFTEERPITFIPSYE